MISPSPSPFSPHYTRVTCLLQNTLLVPLLPSFFCLPPIQPSSYIPSAFLAPNSLLIPFCNRRQTPIFPFAYDPYATRPTLSSLASNVVPQHLQHSACARLLDTFLEHNQKRRTHQGATFCMLADSGPAQRDKATRARLPIYGPLGRRKAQTR